SGEMPGMEVPEGVGGVVEGVHLTIDPQAVEQPDMFVTSVVETGDGAVDKAYWCAFPVQLEECRGSLPVVRLLAVTATQPEGIGRGLLTRQACLFGPIDRLRVDEGGDAVDVDHRTKAAFPVPGTDQCRQLPACRASRDSY